MAKPIILIKSDFCKGMEGIQESLSKKLNDYHVLFIETFDGEFSFEVFYEKDFNHIKYDELKDIIIKACENP